MRVREIAGWLNATFEGDGEREIRAAAPLDTAGADEISFAGAGRPLRDAHNSAAGCLLVAPAFDNSGGRTIIRVPEPRAAMALVAARLHPRPKAAPGTHPTAVVAASASLGEGVSIGPFAVIGEEAVIGAGCVIGPHCTIGNRVRIGADGLLHAGVRIYDDVTIGARCVLHSGCVIGADGFGFVRSREGYAKFPQVGRVSIGDDVEIGANSAVDRAALGVTSLGDGVKLDNMVHVAHNCRIGNHVVIAAQTGMAGGCVVEDWAVLGGQVGLGENVTIQSGAVLGSGSGVLSSKIVRGGGTVYWGTPARPLKEYLEGLANLAKVPALREEIARLREALESLGKAARE
jgi:UDP-3-O-[3-hydroxymyristoyl] glucosamine N-acyltransferase